MVLLLGAENRHGTAILVGAFLCDTSYSNGQGIATLIAIRSARLPL